MVRWLSSEYAFDVRLRNASEQTYDGSPFFASANRDKNICLDVECLSRW
jgi:hypothetical protein